MQVGYVYIVLNEGEKFNIENASRIYLNIYDCQKDAQKKAESIRSTYSSKVKWRIIPIKFEVETK